MDGTFANNYKLAIKVKSKLLQDANSNKNLVRLVTQANMLDKLTEIILIENTKRVELINKRKEQLNNLHRNSGKFNNNCGKFNGNLKSGMFHRNLSRITESEIESSEIEIDSDSGSSEEISDEDSDSDSDSYYETDSDEEFEYGSITINEIKNEMKVNEIGNNINEIKTKVIEITN